MNVHFQRQLSPKDSAKGVLRQKPSFKVVAEGSPPMSPKKSKQAVSNGCIGLFVGLFVRWFFRLWRGPQLKLGKLVWA